MFVIRRQLQGSEGSPPNTRVNPDTGEVETSMDGGETWTPNPAADPRINPAYQLPPNTQPDVRCAAAAGMVENVRRVVNAVGTGTTTAGIATVLITLLLIPGIGWMFAAMLLFAGAFAGGIGAATLAAFTEDIYDALLCLFLDQLDDDGRITDEGLGNVHAAAAGQGWDVLVPDALALIFDLHKAVGFNNAGAVYADGEADCDDCAGWCHLSDLLTTQDSWSIDSGSGGALGVYTPPIETSLYFQVEAGGAYYQVFSINRTFAATFVSGIVIRGVISWGNNLSGLQGRGIGIQALNGGGVVASASEDPTTLPDGAFEIGLPVGAVINQINVYCTAGYADSSGSLEDPGGAATLNEITVSGDGDNPLGDDNCEE